MTVDMEARWAAVKAREERSRALRAEAERRAAEDLHGRRQKETRNGWNESEVKARVNVYYSSYIQLSELSDDGIRDRASDYWFANLMPEHAAACRVLEDRGTTLRPPES